MPLTIENRRRKQFPDPEFLTLDNFKRGVITLIDKSRLPKNALEEADNIFLYEDGMPGPRPGVDWFGEAPGKTAVASASQSPSSSLSPSSSRSPSASVSVSASASRSPSSSRSPSASVSASLSPSASTSPSSSRSPSASISISLSISPSSSLSPSASSSPSSSVSRSPSASISPSSSSSPSSSLSPSASVSLSVSPSPSADDWPDIDGFDYFDYNGAIHLVAAAGGVIFRSTDDGSTWTQCTGATYTAGTDVNFNQYDNYLYITNGVDNIIRYSGSTTLSTYTALTQPAAPTVSEQGTLGNAGFSYTYKIARVNAIGFSEASSAGGTAIETNLERSEWTTSNFARIVTPTASTDQTRWDIFISTDGTDYYYLDSVAAVASSTATYDDFGTALPNPSITAPTGNTTQGPLVEELTNVGSRMYGVRDTANRYRIWFSSGSEPKGAFSSAYDGGYIDWQEGGKYIPKKVADYRDGKGTPYATVWCDSADGQGCIIQISLETLTVGDISITVPSAYKLPGSRGTPSPGSVVNVLNDYYFYNSQAFYNLGSRAQFLNLLSTDEASANIRPSVKQITSSGESMIASVYFDAKVYFSVPYGSSTNNATAVYDTEQKAWLPRAFTIGFKKFLRYTDTSGNKRLLALKPGDSKISEISSNFGGDYGVPFQTSLVTGLYPTQKNRFDFQFVEEGQIELSNPQGEINVELIGIERSQGYQTQKSETIESTLVDTGWDTFLWDSTSWDDTSDAPDTFSESSVKRYFTVQRELNAVQWRITTNSLDARYVLRTLQTWGTPTTGGMPRQWRI